MSRTSKAKPKLRLPSRKSLYTQLAALVNASSLEAIYGDTVADYPSVEARARMREVAADVAIYCGEVAGRIKS